MLCGAVAAAAEAVMAADEGGLGLPVEPGEGDDLLDRQAGDPGRPFRRARRHVRGQLVRRIGVAAQVVPVGIAFLEQDMHDGHGQRAVGAGTHREMDVGLLGRAGAVGIDHDQLGAALLGAHGVGHDVDLGVHRVAAPDHHQLGMLVDLAHVGAALGADAGDPAGVRQRHADGREPARVLHRMAQPVDAVALHQPHRAGVVVRPHRLAAVLARLGDELLGDDVERVGPRDLGELPGPLGAGPAQRLHQPVGMVDALGVARDLLADHPGGVVVAHRAAHPADAPGIQPLDIQRAGAGAVVRADRGHDGDAGFNLLGPCRGCKGMIVGGHSRRSAKSAAAYRASAHGNTPPPPRLRVPIPPPLPLFRPRLSPPSADDRAVFVIDGEDGPGRRHRSPADVRSHQRRASGRRPSARAAGCSPTPPPRRARWA